MSGRTGICGEYCTSCMFSSKVLYLCCDYYLMTGKRRPCPAGDECTAKMETKRNRSLDQLYRKYKLTMSPIDAMKAIEKAKTAELEKQTELMKRYRAAFGYLQKDAAKHLGVSKNAFGSWERGEYFASPKNIVVIEAELKRKEKDDT